MENNKLYEKVKRLEYSIKELECDVFYLKKSEKNRITSLFIGALIGSILGQLIVKYWL